MSRAHRRRAEGNDLVELNLNSMMDLFAVLIPALLMMSAVVEVCVLNVSAPAIGAPSNSDQPDTPDKPPLNLTVTITDKGYIVAGTGAVLNGAPAAAGAEQGPTIPIVKKNIVCSRYRNTWPPPRERNRNDAKCVNPLEERSFWVYDTEALTAKIREIKDAFPEEHRIIIVAEPDIEYESVIDVMDATRDYKDSSGEMRILFDEAVLSPGIF